MSTPRGIVRVVLALGLSALGAGPSRADPVVRLVGWAGEGTVVPGRGNGPDLIELVAEAEWDRAASHDPSRYLIRVTLPDGRAETRAFPVGSLPGRRRFPVVVPAASVRDLPPGRVKVAVAVLDAASGSPLGDPLEATIEQFPRRRGDASANDPGPFGWGSPLDGPTRILPKPGPDGLNFARVAARDGSPGFFLAITEATVRQLGVKVKGYDPKTGRSDEFALEGPDQPAVGLTPSNASAYLKALSDSDPSGPTYRLPTSEEWTRAALGGQTSPFWWGDAPSFPEGANLLGDEPAQAGDATSPSLPPTSSPAFRANPIGLFHTFGNVAEWATAPGGGFARMGGHFRTEPASPLPEVVVTGPDEVGPDPFVGVRPAFGLTPEAGSALARKRLDADPSLGRVAVAYDPDRATVRLTGPVAGPASRRSADRLLEPLWYVAAVENRLEAPANAPDQIAILGGPSGPPRRVVVNARATWQVPLTVRWLDPLPVSGSGIWVNVEFPGGGRVAHKLTEVEPGRLKTLTVVIDPAASGWSGSPPASVVLSLGASTDSGGPVASNPAAVSIAPPRKSP